MTKIAAFSLLLLVSGFGCMEGEPVASEDPTASGELPEGLGVNVSAVTQGHCFVIYGSSPFIKPQKWKENGYCQAYTGTQCISGAAPECNDTTPRVITPTYLGTCGHVDANPCTF